MRHLLAPALLGAVAVAGVNIAAPPASIVLAVVFGAMAMSVIFVLRADQRHQRVNTRRLRHGIRRAAL